MGEDMVASIISRNRTSGNAGFVPTPYEKSDYVFLSREEADQMRAATSDLATALKLVERGKTSDTDLVEAMETKGNNMVGAAAALKLSETNPNKLLEYALRH